MPCEGLSATTGKKEKKVREISKKALRKGFLKRLRPPGKVSQIAVKNILLQLFGEKISSHIKI